MVAVLARRLSARGAKDANILAGMIGGFLAIVNIVVIQFAPSAFWAFVALRPGHAVDQLAVRHRRRRPAGDHAAQPARPGRRGCTCSFRRWAMMRGPPIAGAFNEYVFPDADGVRYSLVTVSSVFGLLGVVLLQFARKPYAASLEAADQRDGMKDSSEKLTAAQRIGYGVGDFGINLFFISTLTYLLYFYTDVFGLSAAAAAGRDAGGAGGRCGHRSADGRHRGAHPQPVGAPAALHSVWRVAAGRISGADVRQSGVQRFRQALVGVPHLHRLQHRLHGGLDPLFGPDRFADRGLP